MTSAPSVGTATFAPAERARAVAAPPSGGAPGSALTEVEMTWIEGRLEQWLRFGRAAGERILSRHTRVAAFRPGATFAFVRWTSNDYGTVFSSIAIATAVAPGDAYATLPFVRPGAEILLRIDGWPKVAAVLAAIDAVEAVGVEACDAAPDHWRHVGNRLAAGLPYRLYSIARHEGWLKRRELEL